MTNIKPVNHWGDSSDGDFSTSSATQNVCDSVTDGEMCVLQYRNLTVNSGHTLIPSVRRRGMIIYVSGNLVVNGTISMKGRGAVGDPTNFGVPPTGLNLFRKTTSGTETGVSNMTGAGTKVVSVESKQSSFGKGINFNFPKVGATGGLIRSQPYGYNIGNDGTNGQSGGGSSGVFYINRPEDGYYGSGGAGGSGTCFSGGSGGGGNFSDLSYNLHGGAGAPFGGQGGVGAGGHPWSGGGGGAGNPGGAGGNCGIKGCTIAAQTGTGGLLILIVKGNITIGPTGKILTEGMEGGNSPEGNLYGGDSGRGPLLILHAGTLSNSGTISTGTLRGGKGSSRVQQIPR